MSDMRWNLDGMKESLEPLRTCVGKLNDASAECASITIPADFSGGEKVKSISGEIEGVSNLVQAIKSSITGIVRKFELAESKNKLITDETLRQSDLLYDCLFKEDYIYFGNDITYNGEYIGNEGELAYSILTPTLFGKFIQKPDAIIFSFGGDGEKGITSGDTFLNHGLNKIVQNSDLNNGNVLIVSIHNKNGTATQPQVISLKEDICNKYNVDSKDCFGIAYSGGGILLEQVANIFEGGIVLIDTPVYYKWIEQITVPIYGFADKNGSYVKNMMALLGPDRCEKVSYGHGEIVDKLYNKDADGNNVSDLFETLFRDNIAVKQASDNETEKTSENIYDRFLVKKFLPEGFWFGQKDEGYEKIRYALGTISTSGCGICASAIAIAALTGTCIKPETIVEQGLLVGDKTNDGTGSEEVTKFLESFEGITVESVWWNDAWGKNKVVEALENGAIVVARNAGGIFTTGGHYVVYARTN